MAANITNHDPIFPSQTVSGNTEFTSGSIPEAAGQTFKRGVPVQLNGAGNVQVWDGATINDGIAGISLQIGQNLGAAGQGAPGYNYGQVSGSKAIQTWGSVQFQPNAVNISQGTPASDGRTLFSVANGDTVYHAQVDNSAGAVANDYIPTVNNMLGKSYGITFDVNGQAYVDIAKATPGTNTVFLVTRYDPIDGNEVNGHVFGQILATARQLQA